jgi:hypothetical protein
MIYGGAPAPGCKARRFSLSTAPRSDTVLSVMIAAIATCLAVIPALVFLRNLRLYTPPPRLPPPTSPAQVSVLIPARNEERSIHETISAALASEDITLEVIALDDHSADQTASIVAALAERDARVRLLTAPPLPPGWSGKAHACAVLARSARYPILLFLDADVRLASDGVRRMVQALESSHADLASGFPHEETETMTEQLVIPLIHFLLLGFLPLWRMRRSGHPAYGAGCGQLFVTRRTAYDQAGGHSAIASSLHDGVTLPRAFRAAGLKTDLFDATDLAHCRMYRSAAEVWHGFAKNAHEGLAKPALIVPATIFLGGGQILPFLVLGQALWNPAEPGVLGLALVGCVAAYLPRLIAARRFRQSRIGALLHPCGILIVLLIQWYAFIRRAFHLPAVWKGREYLADTR